MKPKRLTCGTPVYHAKYGHGTVYGMWGPLPSKNSTKKAFSSCDGIYDVIFTNRDGDPFLHCCTAEYLKIGL